MAKKMIARFKFPGLSGAYITLGKNNLASKPCYTNWYNGCAIETTATLLCAAPDPSPLELVRAMESARAEVFDAIALPPEMVNILEDPRRYTADVLRERHAAAMPSLFGMQVHFSKLLSDMPVKIHRKRRNQSVAYHRRIQKKWNKRFGVGPVAVLMRNMAAIDSQTKNR